jgi:hypothetical protein
MSLEFFSVEGKRLIDKGSMLQEFYEITGISIKALQGTALHQFIVEERLSWAGQLQVTRKENQVYSLLGIFDVYMPLLYGEDREQALVRLRREISRSISEEYVLPETQPKHTKTADKPDVAEYASLADGEFRLFMLHNGDMGSTITGDI